MISLMLNPTRISMKRRSGSLCYKWSVEVRWSSAMHDDAHLEFIGEQVQGTSPCYRLDAVMHPQFLEDMGHMTFDGIQGDHQHLSNLLVGVAACDQLEHVQFAFA